MSDKRDSLDLFIQYLEFQIKICLDIIHPNTWTESNTKKDYDLWIIKEGTVKLEYCDSEYILHKDDMFLFYPQLLYHASALSEQCQILFVHFDANLGSNSRALDNLPCSGYIPAYIGTKERENFYSYYEAFQKEESLSYLLIKGGFLSLMAKVIQYKCNDNEHTLDIPSGKHSVYRLYPVLHYIDQNLHRTIYNSELAKIIGMSEKYFIAFFKKAIGTTPAEYILQSRMKKAIQYLHEQKYSVKEVSALLGYTDAYTFSKSFKKIYGIPPSQI